MVSLMFLTSRPAQAVIGDGAQEPDDVGVVEDQLGNVRRDGVARPPGQVEEAFGIGIQDGNHGLDQFGPGRDALVLLDVIEVGRRDVEGAGQFALADPPRLAQAPDGAAERRRAVTRHGPVPLAGDGEPLVSSTRRRSARGWRGGVMGIPPSFTCSQTG